jgi:hypothetical protein
VVDTPRPDSYDDGYPRSSEADLDPGSDVSESLADADLAASDEHRVAPERRQDGSFTNEDGFANADDVDDAEPEQ